MPHLGDLAGVMQASSSFLAEAIALVYLSQQQTASIRGYPTPGEIGHDFLVEKAFKGELVMADCFHRVSCLRSCLFCDFSILADTLCLFKHFSCIIRANPFI